MAVGAPSIGAVASTAGAGTLQMPYPAVTSVGRLLLCYVAMATNASPATPSGFTSIQTAGAGAASPFTRMSRKSAAGETGTLDISVSAAAQGWVMSFPDVDLTNPVIDFDFIERSSGNTSYLIPSMTSESGAAAVYGGAANTNTGTWSPPTTPAAFTETHDDASPNPHICGGYLLGPGASSTGTLNLTRSTSIRGAAIGVVLRAAPSGTVYEFAEWNGSALVPLTAHEWDGSALDLLTVEVTP
jgi:hypothetical protein